MLDQVNRVGDNFPRRLDKARKYRDELQSNAFAAFTSAALRRNEFDRLHTARANFRAMPPTIIQTWIEFQPEIHLAKIKACAESAHISPMFATFDDRRELPPLFRRVDFLIVSYFGLSDI